MYDKKASGRNGFEIRMELIELAMRYELARYKELGDLPQVHFPSADDIVDTANSFYDFVKQRDGL